MKVNRNWGPSVVVLAVLVFCFGPAAAQNNTCSVGSRVQVEMIDNATGTITEIGTQVPHVGWYRIVYDWNVRSGNPQGEWYNPKNREIVIAGTRTKCGQPASPGNSRPPAGSSPRPGGSQPTVDLGDECPMTSPPGNVTKTARASAGLFKRVIYERMAARVGGSSISSPKQIGLTFVEFAMGTAYRNTLTSNRLGGDKRLHDGAPVGATIYTVKTKYVKCELYDRSITRWVIQQNFACFKDRFGDWVCPTDSTPKFLEQRSIPVR